METLFYYILRTSIATAVLYLFFKLFLSKNRQHQYNRFIILFFFVCSIILPFFSLDISGLLPQNTLNNLNYQNINIVENIPAQANQVKMIIPWETIFTGLYMAGAMFLFIFFSISLLRMFHIIRTSQQNKLYKRIKLCISKKDISPFSWMNYLVLSNEDYAEKNSSIIEHEMAHISYRHSLDMIIANIYTIIFWFNPFAWLLRKELQTIHEYQADEKVISAGVDIKEYQLLLIRKCVGENKFMLANNFEYSNLQKRIKMIMNTQAKKQKRWIYSAIPLLLIAITVIFSLENLHAKAASETSDNISLKNNSAFTKIESTQNGITEIKKNVIVEKKKNKNKIIIKNATRATKDTTNVKRTGVSNDMKASLFILDGKEVDGSVIENLNPKNIETMSVLKDKAATSIYGDRGKNGVIIVTQKRVTVKVKELENAMFIVDGATTSKTDALKIPESNIKRMTVLKGTTGEKEYGIKEKMEL